MWRDNTPIKNEHVAFTSQSERRVKANSGSPIDCREWQCHVFIVRGLHETVLMNPTRIRLHTAVSSVNSILVSR